MGPSKRPLEDVRVVAGGLVFPEGPVALGDGSVLVTEMRRGVVSRVDVGGGSGGGRRSSASADRTGAPPASRCPRPGASWPAPGPRPAWPRPWPATTTRPAPLLGQHNDEVLYELGFDAEGLARLRAEQVVGEVPLGL